MNAESKPELSPDFCPYQGLEPYTEAQRAYFFGRERDNKIIISNLHGTPLSVLYGVSGVGKSSVLLAGVAPELRRTDGLAVVVWREWQGENFAVSLKHALLDAVSRSLQKERRTGVTLPQPSLPFDELLLECNRALDGPVFLIFDQWEEYFLYHPPSPSGNGFETEFARAVNRRDIAANFLLSMREEELSKLDRFRSTIPNLLGNMLRLKHLDHAAAERAIREPLRVFNERVPEGRRMIIEDELVQSLIEKARQDPLAQSGPGQTGPLTTSEQRIETPVLQMLLTRLWQEERNHNSLKLQAATLEKLGGAENVVASYFDDAIEGLSEAERDTAASIFRYLVTPTGSKMAQMPDTLAKWARLPLDQVASLLERLSMRTNIRILRKVTVAGRPDHYEIFHDVLGPAILAWVQQHDQAQAELEAKKEAEERERVRQLELERAQKLAEAERQRAEEQQRRAVAERQRVKLLRWGLLAMTILLIAMACLAYIAGQSFIVAKAAEKKAIDAQKDADEQRGRISDLREDAEKKEKKAQDAEQRAQDAEEKAIEEQSRAEQAKAGAEAARATAITQQQIYAKLKLEALASEDKANAAAREAGRLKILADQATEEAKRKGDQANLARSQAEKEKLNADSALKVAKRRKQEADNANREAEKLLEVVRNQDDNAPDSLATLRTNLGQVERVELSGQKEDLIVISEKAVGSGSVTKRAWKMKEKAGKDNKYSLVEVTGLPGTRSAAVTCPPNGKTESLGLKPDPEGRFLIPGLNKAVALQDKAEIKKQIEKAVLSPDGLWIATAGKDGIARVYEASTGKRKAILRPHSALLFYSPKSFSRIKSFPWIKYGYLNKGKLKGLNSVAFDGTGKYLVTAGNDWTVRVYRIENREPLAKYSGHTDAVESAVFSPCGNRIVSVSKDQTVRVWDFTAPKNEHCKNCWP